MRALSLPIWMAGSALLVAAAAPLGAQPALAGSQLRVDAVAPYPLAFLGAYQWGGFTKPDVPAVAPLPGGGFVVVWGSGFYGADLPELSGIYGRRFKAGGEPAGGVFTVTDLPRSEYPFTLDVAADASGRFLVVWEALFWTPESGSVLGMAGRLFDADGEPSGETFQIGQTGGRPAAVAATAGGFVVIWEGPGGIRARYLDADGEPIGDELVPLPEPDLHWPSIAATPDGGFVAAGVQRLPATGAVVREANGRPACRMDRPPEGQVLIRRFDAQGRPLGSSVVAGLVTDFHLAATALAVAPDGGFVVTWGAEARRFDPAARPFGETLCLLSCSPSQRGSALVVAADDSGGFFFAWQDELRSVHLDGAGILPLPDIMGRYLEAHGTEPGPPVRVSSLTAHGHWLPDVAALEGGELVVVWVSEGWRRWLGVEEQGLAVLAQRLGTAGPGVLQLDVGHAVVSEGEGELRLGVTRREGTSGAVSAQIVAIGLDAVAGRDFQVPLGSIVFEDGDSVPKEVVLPILQDPFPERDETLRLRLSATSGGAAFGEPTEALVEIRDDDLPSPLLAAAAEPILLAEMGWRPSLAAAGEGFVATWGDLRRPGARRFDAAGQPLSWLWRLEPGFPIEDPWWDSAPGSVVAHPDGSFTVVWGQYQLETQQTLHCVSRRIAPSGRPAGPPLLALGQVPPDAVAVAPGLGGGLIVAWAEPDDSGGGVSIRLQGPGGELRAEAQAPESSFGDQKWPALAADAEGGFLIAWQSFTYQAPGNGIHARRFDATGAATGGEVRLDEAARGLPSQPRVATDPRGGFVAVWQVEGEEGGIRGRRLDAQGQPLGGELWIGGSARSGASSPVVAIQVDGRFLVVWESEGVLVGQAFNASGRRLGAAFPIAPDLPGRQVNPAVVALEGGGFVVAWEHQPTDANPQIWARLLAARDLKPCRVTGPWCPGRGRFGMEAEVGGPRNGAAGPGSSGLDLDAGSLRR